MLEATHAALQATGRQHRISSALRSHVPAPCTDRTTLGFHGLNQGIRTVCVPSVSQTIIFKYTSIETNI
jgi:hypothetical protein